MEIALNRPLLDGIGMVSQWFGEGLVDYSRFNLAGHNGIDYAAPLGSPVLAAHAGRCQVRYAADGYGENVRVIADDGRYETIYGHLTSALVTDNQRVAAGEIIGAVGSTGNSTGPHLHFGLRLAQGRNPAYGDWVDPLPFRDVTASRSRQGLAVAG